MTIITSKEELEKKLQRAREDIAYWRVYTWEEVKNSINKKMNKNKLCIK